MIEYSEKFGAVADWSSFENKGDELTNLNEFALATKDSTSLVSSIFWRCWDYVRSNDYTLGLQEGKYSTDFPEKLKMFIELMECNHDWITPMLNFGTVSSRAIIETMITFPHAAIPPRMKAYMRLMILDIDLIEYYFKNHNTQKI